MIPDTSGPTLLVPLAHYDPASSCWRTSQGMFPSDWPTSSETCPRWGMTRAGELFELPTPALPTAEPASSSPLLPTPVADHSRGLPQPGTDFQSLPNAVISLLPTPAVNDMGAGKTVEDWDAWTDRMKAKHGNGNGHGPSLSIEALRLLPTPTAMDSVGARNATASRQPDSQHHAGTTLTDAFWIAGGYTDQPSPDGQQSSDDPLPFPPSPDATAPD